MTPTQIDVEIKARRDFCARLAESRHVYVVSGEEGLARVPSQQQPGREVTLFWTEHAEAEQWADVLATNPRIKMLPLTDVLTDVLPKLGELNRLVGTNWNDVPVEAEVAPLDLVGYIRGAMVDHFVQKTLETKCVWMLQGIDGPACQMSQKTKGALVLPVWADRAAAEARVEGPWADMEVGRVPLADFKARTLMWAAETKRKVAPAYCEGPGVLELEPWELKGRFASMAMGEQAVA